MADSEKKDGKQGGSDAGITGFWGSVASGGGDVMLNLRLVRYARPSRAGTTLFFSPDDWIEVAADFATVSRRLYQAYDGGTGGGDGEAG